MSMKIGTIDLRKIVAGTSNVKKVYIGSTLVYEHDYNKDYLTLEALESGTISFTILKDMGTSYITSISYSKNNGAWTTTNNTNNKSADLKISVNVVAGDRILWKGVGLLTGYYNSSEDNSMGSFFSSTCKCNAEGNIMSMLYADNFIGQTTLSLRGQFACLFSDYTEEDMCKIVDTKNLKLPATTLSLECYEYMFYACTLLTSTPSILPSTTLAQHCYDCMFYSCSTLTSVPKLPATTLANNCYNSMFYGCTLLTVAPELPATTLVSNCYHHMFLNCNKLFYVKAFFTTTPSISYTLDWLSGVLSKGIFIKNSSATWTNSGVHAKPSNWVESTKTLPVQKTSLTFSYIKIALFNNGNHTGLTSFTPNLDILVIAYDSNYNTYDFQILYYFKSGETYPISWNNYDGILINESNKTFNIDSDLFDHSGDIVLGILFPLGNDGDSIIGTYNNNTNVITDASNLSADSNFNDLVFGDANFYYSEGDEALIWL